jgi:hypothetical protein
MAKEILQNAKDVEVTEETPTQDINEKDLGQDQDDDEATLSQALQANPVKRFFLRLVIKLKNRISVIPMILVVVCLIVLTFHIHEHVNAVMKLTNDGMNAFYFFSNVLLSLVLLLTYLRIYGKESNKKLRIGMYVLFALALGGELFFDFYHLADIRVETSLTNSLNKVVDNPADLYIAKSQYWTTFHIVMLCITAASAALAPLLQPLFKKIHIKVK